MSDAPNPCSGWARPKDRCRSARGTCELGFADSRMSGSADVRIASDGSAFWPGCTPLLRLCLLPGGILWFPTILTPSFSSIPERPHSCSASALARLRTGVAGAKAHVHPIRQESLSRHVSPLRRGGLAYRAPSLHRRKRKGERCRSPIAAKPKRVEGGRNGYKNR